MKIAYNRCSCLLREELNVIGNKHANEKARIQAILKLKAKNDLLHKFIVESLHTCRFDNTMGNFESD